MSTHPENAPDAWCRTCGTRHAASGDCPGVLLTTGPERAVWSQAIRIDARRDVVTVRVAPAGRYWVARIVTEPRSVWVVPGGGGARKFVGRVEDEAARRAAAHVREICSARGWTPAGAGETVTLASLLGGRTDDTELSAADLERRERERKPCDLPVAFASTTLRHRARLFNVSERGVFVTTDAPAESGTPLTLQVRLPDGSLPLRGTVVWNRPAEETGRPRGMGVRLHRPPALYVRFVRELPAV